MPANDLMFNDSAPDAAPDAAQNLSADGLALGVGLWILVTEDNQNLNEILCEMLSMMGHVTYGAMNAETALLLADQHRFDVLMTDISLPGLSGIALARKMLVLQPHIKVVFASGYGAPLAQNLPFANYVLPKPYDMQQIETLLKVLR